MRVCYTPRYYADIGEGHVFPIRTFALVRARLVAEGTLAPGLAIALTVLAFNFLGDGLREYLDPRQRKR